MQIIVTTPALDMAVQVQNQISEVTGFVTAGLRRIYDLVNTEGQQQAILDQFGSNGTTALSAYIAFQSAMELIAPGAVPIAKPAVFVPQPDGSILFVPPPPIEIPAP